MIKIGLLSLLLALFAGHITNSDSEDQYSSKRSRMVDKQIFGRGVIDENVLGAMRKVKRHLFVPERFRPSAYEDHPLPIGHDQTISQPFIVAYMTSLLKLRGSEKVLEIGTGSGYQAAVLAEIAGEVYTIEIVKELAESSKALLNELGYQNVHVKHGDGFKGWDEFAPFDAIIVTAAPLEIPQKLVDQLKIGGRMIIPVGEAHNQKLILVTKRETGIKKHNVLPVRFVPMVKGED